MKVGMVYLIIHRKLKEKAGKDGCFTRKGFFEFVCRSYCIPKKYRYVVLKELESYGMVKSQDKDLIRIMGCKDHLDSSKVYREMKMF